MNPDDFSFADCYISKTIKTENNLKIYFPLVFCLKENRYVSGFLFIIQDWIDLVIQIFHQSKPFDNFTQRQVSILESDDLALIQELIWFDNSL